MKIIIRFIVCFALVMLDEFIPFIKGNEDLLVYVVGVGVGMIGEGVVRVVVGRKVESISL